MQRFVLLASVAAAQCALEPAAPTNLPTAKACQQFDATAAIALDGDGSIPDTMTCAPVCNDAAAQVPAAATLALYTCTGTTAVANYDCVAGCPAQGPATADDLTRSLTQGYCGSDAAATNWVAKDVSCTNQCTKADTVAWPKVTKCGAGQLVKYQCPLKTSCIVINKSTLPDARATKNCDNGASETFDADNKGSIIAVDKKCVFQCPDKYKLKGTVKDVTCGTDTDYNEAQDKVNEFECEKDDSDTGSASSISFAVSLLAVMKAAFA